MAQFESLREQIAGAGANLLYFAGEKRTGFFKPARYFAKNPVSFPFLLDENRAVIKTYGLYHRFGADALRIAYPATLVIDRGGVIRFIYRGDSQADRAPLEQVLDALQTLQASG